MSGSRPDTDRLAAAYQRLLWAYPRWYRRDRGAELLTTLLDDARPGQRRPNFLDALDLIRSGLWTRLRPHAGAGAVFVATIGALYLAIVAAAVAVHVSPYPGPPTDARAIAAATAAIGSAPRDVPGPVIRCGQACPVWEKRSGDDVVAYDVPPEDPDTVVVHYDPPWEDAAATVARARERLASDGWQAGRLTVEASGITWFTATRADLTMSVRSLIPPSNYYSTSVHISVAKTATTAVVLAFVAGGVVGLVAGWAMTVWVQQRLPRSRLRGYAGPLGALFAVLASFTVLPTLLVGGQALVDETTSNSPAVQIPAFFLTVMPVLTVATVISGLLSLTLALVSGPANVRPDAYHVRHRAQVDKSWGHDEQRTSGGRRIVSG